MKEDRTVYDVVDEGHFVPQQLVSWNTVNERYQQTPVNNKSTTRDQLVIMRHGNYEYYHTINQSINQ